MNVVHWGAGKLGLSLGVWNAHCGHDVIFVDSNPDTVRAINERRSPIDEPRVQALLESPTGGQICAAQSGDGPVEGGIVKNADIIFIVVPTPSLGNGAFDLSCVEESCWAIGKALRQKLGYTLIVCVSTIMPGDSRELIEAIEDASGEPCGGTWGFAYSPEFVRQGSVVHDYANPDVLLIGASDAAAADTLAVFYETVVQNAPEVFHMSLESAEIAKIGLNAAVVTKIAVANQLAWLCHRTPGANAKHVLDSIGADPRIGSGYFSAGLWPGGPCFPRDCRALAVALAQRNLASSVARAVHDSARSQADHLSQAIISYLPPVSATVGLLGLTYKPGVSLLDESQSLLLAKRLADRVGSWVKVIAYDPDVAVGMSVPTMRELAQRSDVIVVMTPKPEFMILKTFDLSGKTLFDCWDCIGRTNADKHIVLGVGDAC